MTNEEKHQLVCNALFERLGLTNPKTASVNVTLQALLLQDLIRTSAIAIKFIGSENYIELQDLMRTNAVAIKFIGSENYIELLRAFADALELVGKE